MHIAYCTESQPLVRSHGFSPEEVAEFKNDEKIRHVIKTLEGLGHTVELVQGIENLALRLTEHRFRNGASKAPWDLVWNDCEGLYGRVRESQAPALLEAFEVPYTHSDALAMATCLDKGLAKMFLQHNSIPTAPFIVLPNDSPNDIESDLYSAISSSSYRKQLESYPLFVKPASEHTSKGISSISKCHDQAELLHAVTSVSEEFPGRDILIESFLTGREFTVAIAGTGEQAKVIGAYAINYPDAKMDFLNHGQKAEQLDGDLKIRHDTKLEGDEQAKKACEVALKTWRLIKGRDIGRVDVRFDSEGRANVIEINPIPGMVEKFSALPLAAEGYGYKYEDLFKMIIESVKRRYPCLRA